MEYIVKFDKEYRQCRATYNFFAEIHNFVKSRKYTRIILDLTEYKYINPVYGVLIGSMPYVGELYNCKIVVRVNPFNEKCTEFLNNLGIFEHYNMRNKKESLDLNNIKFKKYEDIEKALPTVGEILEKAPVEFSEELKDVMESKLAEIFLNAFTHSGSKIGVFCSGYKYY